MNKGRIIFLNGVTSAGKTSIVEALQNRDDVFFYVVANDLFQEMVGEKFLRENYWKYLSEVSRKVPVISSMMRSIIWAARSSPSQVIIQPGIMGVP